eukprot:scaffold17574_cov54-Phaeocystis_antarctica.AAC.1
MSWRLTSWRLSAGALAPLAGALAALTAPTALTAGAGAPPPLRALSIDAAITGLKTEPSWPPLWSMARLSTVPIICSSQVARTAPRNLGLTPARSTSQVLRSSVVTAMRGRTADLPDELGVSCRQQALESRHRHVVVLIIPTIRCAGRASTGSET